MRETLAIGALGLLLTCLGLIGLAIAYLLIHFVATAAGAVGILGKVGVVVLSAALALAIGVAIAIFFEAD